MEFLLIGLILLAIPFVAPIVSWIRISNLRFHVNALEREVREQRELIAELNARVRSLTLPPALQAAVQPTSAPAAPAKPPIVETPPAAATPPTPPPVRPLPTPPAPTPAAVVPPRSPVEAPTPIVRPPIVRTPIVRPPAPPPTQP